MRRLALALLLCAAAHGANYEISDYAATFQVSRGTSDVAARLEITYHILSGTKSDGFKYTGQLLASHLSGTDDRGRLLEVGFRDHKLSWSFPEAGPGYKRVMISFTLRDALRGARTGGNVLDFGWVGEFRVPVRRATYTILLPVGLNARIEAPPEAIVTEQVAMLTQEPLRHQRFRVKFTPGVVDTPRGEGSGVVESVSVGVVIGLLTIGVVAAIIIAASLSAVKANGNSGSGSGGCSGAIASGGCGGGGCGGGGCGGGGCGG